MIPLSRPLLGADEIAAVARVLQSGMLASGPEVEAFEAEFAHTHGVEHAVAVGSGTAALHLGLVAAGVSEGDEVILPSFTFGATAGSVRLVGARPVFADIDPATLCLTRSTVEPLLSRRTVAVIQVHLYGQPAALDDLSDLCRHNGLLLVEDAAQAHGALWRGKPVGGLGDFGAFSFYPTKNMTTGEGGMVTTNDEEMANGIRLLRNHGMTRKYWHDRVGFNSRMTDLAAAIGRVQLSRLADWNQRRRENALYYNNQLSSIVRIPREIEPATHVYHQYTVRHHDRSQLTAVLERNKVGYGIYYPYPLHTQRAFAIGRNYVQLAETELASKEVVSIPVRPDLTARQLDTVVSAIAEGVDGL